MPSGALGIASVGNNGYQESLGFSMLGEARLRICVYKIILVMVMTVPEKVLKLMRDRKE